MKNKKIFLALLLILTLFMFSACGDGNNDGLIDNGADNNGPNNGTNGTNGTNGNNGTNGTNGTGNGINNGNGNGLDNGLDNLDNTNLNDGALDNNNNNR